MREADLWRVLSRDANLAQSVVGATALLRAEFPIDGVVVCRLELSSRRLAIVAMDWQEMPAQAAPSWRQWSDDQLDRLLAWHPTGSCLRGSPARDVLLGLLCPVTPDAEVIAWPLQDEGHDPGILAFMCGRDGPGAVNEEQLRNMVEPFKNALINDRRFHEIRRLRETLEADKRALLTRLDRDSMVDTIVGADSGLAELMEKVKQVAPTDAPVLIFGETGSGKEVVARAIHARSRRGANAIVRVNCGAIPAGLVDSDLFGHERGSFTGAVATRHGWFERADGGTLFLDEIGELPLEAQVRLLRVLQDGTIERVGGARTLHVDVRIVAATNRDLKEMVSRGAFREDLWYRLSVFPLALPPLRERQHDLPELAAHFAALAGKRLGRAPLSLSAKDVDLLLAYHWPGNVRELAAVIERAAILGDGRALDIATALGTVPARNAMPWQPAASVRAFAPFPTLDQLMSRHIEEALARTLGRVEGEGGAAHLLGINPHTLRSRMRKLGIHRARFCAALRR